jgi:hypothetical protein
MRYGSGFTSSYAGGRGLTITRPARSARIADLLALPLFDAGNWLSTQGVELIFTDFQRICRAYLYTPAASIAPIGIDDDKPVP